MKSAPVKINVGARDSKLAVAQTRNALARINRLLPNLELIECWMQSPGDRDQKTDLRTSAADFFTRDLDDALRDKKIDIAVHSAKDLPDVIADDIDWFWLPWREDPRDVLIINKAFEIKNGFIVKKGDKGTANHPGLRLGISSERREQYCSKRFPDGVQLPIRGNIDGRIEQLDNGDYDMIVMAAAGMNRLSLQGRIDEFIPLEDLPSPEGQGYLAATFRKGDPVVTSLRKLFVKPITIAGAGPGEWSLTPVATIDALKTCDICLYDALSDEKLLNFLPKTARAVYVGKRSGKHSMQQQEICCLISQYSREGRKVVRLKGGDPGIFGRLAEEIDILDELQIAYNVIPAASSLCAATTGTGLLLTRRGLSRGFSVMTPRRAQSKDFLGVPKEERVRFPQVFFMGVTKVTEIVSQLKDEGLSGTTPASLVFSAGRDNEHIEISDLDNVASIAEAAQPMKDPGLLIVGENASGKYLYKNHGIFANASILITGSETIQKKSYDIVRSNGGLSTSLPLIDLQIENSCITQLEQISNFDWLTITSPAAARFFIDIVRESKIDFRSIPKLITCGPATSEPFTEAGIYPEIEATNSFGAKGLIEAVQGEIKAGETVLRLTSNLAGNAIPEALGSLGAKVTVAPLYTNTAIDYDSCPEFDVVFFASSSAAKSFITNFGEESLQGKTVLCIGEPTAKVVDAIPQTEIIIADTATVEGSFDALAAHYVNKSLEG